MPKIKSIIHAEIDPSQPVQELCDVIAAVLSYHPGQEVAVLDQLQHAIAKHQNHMKGVAQHGKDLSETGRGQQDPQRME